MRVFTNLEMHTSVTPFMVCLVNPKVAVTGRWIPLFLGSLGVCASDTSEPLPGRAERDLLCNVARDSAEAFPSGTTHCNPWLAVVFC